MSDCKDEDASRARNVRDEDGEGEDEEEEDKLSPKCALNGDSRLASGVQRQCLAAATVAGGTDWRTTTTKSVQHRLPSITTE